MSVALRALAEILHPDMFYFVTWGREAKPFIKNLAGFNMQNIVKPSNDDVAMKDRKYMNDPRFTQTYYELFRHERGVPGDHCMPG